MYDAERLDKYRGLAIPTGLAHGALKATIDDWKGGYVPLHCAVFHFACAWACANATPSMQSLCIIRLRRWMDIVDHSFETVYDNLESHVLAVVDEHFAGYPQLASLVR